MQRRPPLANRWLHGHLAGLEQEILRLYWQSASEDNEAARQQQLDEYDEAIKLQDELRALLERC